MAESTTIKWDQGDDGIVVLTLDDPNQSANTMNDAYKASMRATVERLEAEKDSITGVVITSAKKTFFAGGDLNDLKRATHHRVIVDDPKAVLGFPEVQLGLLPGAGGVTRSVRMFGIANALLQLLLQGQRVRPAQALEMGLVGEVVGSVDELVPAAKKWIAA